MQKVSPSTLVHDFGPRQYLYKHCIQRMTECPCFPSRGSDQLPGSAYSSQPPAKNQKKSSTMKVESVMVFL